MFAARVDLGDDGRMGPVVVVQHEPSVPPGSIVEVLEAAGAEHLVLQAWRTREWPEARDLGALVVMGGTMNVDQTDDHPFLLNSRDLMRDSLEWGVPTLGVCLGSQMMARVLGADVFRSKTRNALFSPLEPTSDGASDPVLEPFAGGIPVLQFHEDTFNLPPGAVCLARSTATGLPQAFRMEDVAYAVQFHFEVGRETIRSWCRNIGRDHLAREWGVSEEHLMDQADRHLDEQRAAGEELVRRFLQI